MKILAIRGKNLASLESEFVIDFEVEPLKSAGIFAITGPTGAGKSTILDAICLALFDNAPRLSSGERNIYVNDVSDKVLSQTDSRIILRKGAGEGYAAVDFIALNGERYRSTWSVRRLKNKHDGILQNTEIRLYNLYTSVEEQGTKTVLLKRITELIGLNFQQFIRAVLLAQGDFATFLKAKQTDKAELLEKLTGTDIYSKISSTIFQKTKESIETFELLQKRKNDIFLLSDEQVAELYRQKERIETELNPIKNTLSSIDKKLDWIKQYEELSKETNEAKTELERIKQCIETAKPRYAYLEILDTSLEVRDVYTDLDNKEKQLQQLKSNLSSQETKLQQCEEQIAGFDAGLQKIKNALEQTEQDYAKQKPLIARSKELDIKIQSVKEKLAESEKELQIKNEQKRKSENNIQVINENLSAIKKQLDSITGWFNEKKSFGEMVQQVDLIIATLGDIRLVEQQIETASQNLNTNNALLVSQKQILEQLEKESEQLNALLPTEILNLRENLKENQPCPVCGSVHHPFKTEINQTTKVNEKELEKKKREKADFIAKTNNEIELLKKSITQCDALIEGCRTQYSNAINKIKKPLQTINNWKNFVSNGVLQERLSKFAIQWKKNEEEQTKNLRQTELYNEKLNTENAVLTDLSAECKRKKALYKDDFSMFESLVNEQSTLLEGKKAGEVESFYTNSIEQQTTKYEELKTSKAKIESRKSEIMGTVSQIQENIKVFSTQISGLKVVVDSWLLKNNQITQDVLKDLVAKSYSWITAEKKELSDLKNRETRFAVTCKERTARLEKHNESTYKPNNNENKESLEQLFDDITNKEKELKHQHADVSVSLAKHNDNKNLVATLDIELQMNAKICEEWKKLNSILGSADGHKFKNIIQSYTMDILLDYANKHLETLTKRYKIEKTGDTLALQVIDNDMFGEIRAINSLSGGESFLISLSLALGLSALSSNRMQIESLFIDEGFGSLDAETFNIAIDALENLYTQGRKIGIISHVGELRIPVQIKVIKSINGKSQLRIEN